MQGEYAHIVRMAVGQHGLHQLQKRLVIPAPEGQLPAAQAHRPQARLALGAIKTDPQVGPGGLCTGLIKGLLVGLNEKALPFAQMVVAALDMVHAPPIQNVVKQVVWADRRAIAVQRFTAGVAAIAEVEIAEFLVLLL